MHAADEAKLHGRQSGLSEAKTWIVICGSGATGQSTELN